MAHLVFDALPCNPLILKGFMFLLLFSSTIFAAKTGELFHKRFGWAAGLIVFLTPSWVAEFTKLENDQLSFPLLFLSQYLFFKGTIEDNIKLKFLALGLAGIATTLWYGSVVYVFAYGLSFIWASLGSIAVLLLKGKEIIQTLFFSWTNSVLENAPLIGLAYYEVLLAGLFRMQKAYKPFLIFFVILTAVNSKFLVHAIPLLAVGSLIFGLHFRERLKIRKPHYVPHFQVGVFCFASIFMLMTSMITMFWIPNQTYWKPIEYAVELADGEKMQADWDVGYWLKWKDGNPTTWGGGAFTL